MFTHGRLTYLVRPSISERTIVYYLGHFFIFTGTYRERYEANKLTFSIKVCIFKLHPSTQFQLSISKRSFTKKKSSNHQNFAENVPSFKNVFTFFFYFKSFRIIYFIGKTECSIIYLIYIKQKTHFNLFLINYKILLLFLRFDLF